MTEYIKREDALKMCSGEIQNIRYMTDVFGKRFEAVVGARRVNADEIAEQIKKIPSADVVERKRGKWVGRSENDCYPVCSECGRTRLGSSLGYCQKYVPFCEHCGADMRELK